MILFRGKLLLCTCKFLWYDEENLKMNQVRIRKMLEQYRTVYQGGEGEIVEKNVTFYRNCPSGKNQKKKL